MVIRVELDEGGVVRVVGPARLRVEEGLVTILGAEYGAGEEVELPRYRSFSVLASRASRLSLALQGGGSLEEPLEGEEVVEEWLEAADKLAGSGSVMVVGPTDAGKTSFTITLLNRGLAAGRSPAVIDADVGQADVGPPGFVSGSLVASKLVSLRQLWAEHLHFVGSVTPSRLEQRIVGGIVDLYWRLRSRGAGLIVVDTDGWTSSLQALEYKAEACRSIGCGAAVCIGCSGELADVFERVFSFTETLRLPSPAVRRERGPGERRELRREGYARYLSGAREVTLGLDSVSILGSCLFSGRMLTREEVEELSRLLGVKVIAASITMDSVYVYYEGGEPGREDLAAASAVYGGRHIYLYRRGCEENTLAAVLAEPGREEPALLKSIDFENNRLTILTRHEGEVKTIILGLVKLREDFEEAGRVSRCVL